MVGQLTKCDLCGFGVQRPNHLAKHRGSASCARKVVERATTMKRPTAGKVIKLRTSLRRPGAVLKRPECARGLAGCGNMRRKIGLRLGPFLERLKQNVLLSQIVGPRRIVEFVPYDPACTAKDIAKLALVIKRHPGWGARRNRPGLVAVTLATMHFFTVKGAEVLHFPDVPWTPSYEKTLRGNLWEMRHEQLFNTGVTHMSCRSFKNLGERERLDKIDMVVESVRLCVDRAEVAIAQAKARARVGGAGGAKADIFYEDVAHVGMPQGSYGQNLAKCLWSYGLRQNSDDGLFPDEVKFGALLSAQTGTCKGISHLTDDAVTALVESKQLQRLRLDLVAKEVKKQWGKKGVRVADPLRGKTMTQRSRALAHQLCEWAKASMHRTCSD
jgi:hypothetical protein